MRIIYKIVCIVGFEYRFLVFLLCNDPFLAFIVGFRTVYSWVAIPVGDFGLYLGLLVLRGRPMWVFLKNRSWFVG